MFAVWVSSDFWDTARKDCIDLVPEIQFLLFISSSIFLTNTVTIPVHCRHSSCAIFRPGVTNSN